MIFVDTSFWVALASSRDDRHDDARTLLQRFGGERLATSNHVRGETWTFISRRHGHAAAVALLERLEVSQRLRVLFTGQELEEEALRWLRRHDERQYSFVDATSFALMHSLRIRQALAFDGDFSAAGLEELRPDATRPG
ncbi:MAG: PIN domain-containing protein [Chloroflexi bacterium]|nr:PIN domain-containing protein [Chloroflexota bacterium]